MTVLDAGCGTGNYARALLPHVARIEALDLSAGMLEVARRKLADAIKTAAWPCIRGSIEDLPLADGAVDGVSVNQVLHHLPDDPAAGWPSAPARARRVRARAAAGRRLVINTCSHAQTEQGFWTYHLIPAARAEILPPPDAARCARGGARRRSASRRAAASSRSTRWSRATITSTRAGRSAPSGGPGIRSGPWSSEAELAAVEHTLLELDARGELEAYVAEHDAMRRHIGQMTFVYGIKA